MNIKRIAIIENGIVTNVATVDIDSGWIPPQGAEAIESEIAQIGWVHDGQEFAEPEPSAVPFSEDFLKQYRAQVIETVISYNGVEALNDADTRSSVIAVMNYLLIANDPFLTIDWKGPNGWHVGVTAKDLQGLAKAGGAWMQKAFTAEKTIMQRHLQNPYLTWDVAKAEFDIEMEE